MGRVRSLGALAMAALALTTLTSCLTAQNVALSEVWDTEAAETLTAQRDITAEYCGVKSSCVEALSADQGVFLKFEDDSDAKAELQSGDDLVREVFVLHWNEGVPEKDKERAIFILENAYQ